eukprot:TRINITY_DN4253_c0_g1_i1.p1 TRINITY_DN4253_c0_g1~~TRINITY_DN4253_c0_g1_i1.p1  ORF type:complete len:570 (+),score=70.76 TRINITY_DN4253_c0_g1_i1:145-1854(+)
MKRHLSGLQTTNRPGSGDAIRNDGQKQHQQQFGGTYAFLPDNPGSVSQHCKRPKVMGGEPLLNSGSSGSSTQDMVLSYERAPAPTQDNHPSMMVLSSPPSSTTPTAPIPPELPLEIKALIIAFLEPRFLLSTVALVSSGWHLATKVSSLWQHHCRQFGWYHCPPHLDWFAYYKLHFSTACFSFRVALRSGYMIWFNPRNGGVGIFGSADAEGPGCIMEYTRNGEHVGLPLNSEELWFWHMFSDYDTDAVYGITKEFSVIVLRSGYDCDPSTTSLHTKTLDVVAMSPDSSLLYSQFVSDELEGVALSRSSVLMTGFVDGESENTALWHLPFPQLSEIIPGKSMWSPEPLSLLFRSSTPSTSPLIASNPSGSVIYLMDYEGNIVCYDRDISTQQQSSLQQQQQQPHSATPARHFQLDLSQLDASGHVPDTLLVHPHKNELLLLALFEENDAPRAARLSVFDSRDGRLIRHYRMPWTQVESIAINRAGTSLCLLSDNHFGGEVLVHLLPYPLPYELEIAPMTGIENMSLADGEEEEDDEEDQDRKRHTMRREEARVEDEVLKHVITKYRLLP